MKKIDEALMREYIEKQGIRGLSGPSWEKYFRDKVGWLVRLSDGTIFEIDKPSIETRFCFGESGYDFDEKVKEAADARVNENLFRIRNLRFLDDKIRALKNSPDIGEKMWLNVIDGWSDYLNHGYEADMERVTCAVHELTADDRKRILEGYEIVRNRFSKRIDSYLKRYGLSKVRSWTYWIDA